jgi:uncharacterized protein (TIGR03083 family)
MIRSSVAAIGMAPRYRRSVTIDQLAAISDATAGLVAAAREGPTTSEVRGCPGWDVAKLCSHVGTVQRWATMAMRTSAEPDRRQLERAQPGAEIDYLEAGLAPLLAALQSRPADDPVWNWSGLQQVAGFWPRRLTHETSVHRWDAEQAIGQTTVIPTDIAIDGIDELFDVFVPARLGGRDGIDIGGTIHFHATDADGEWTWSTGDGVFTVNRGHAKGDCAVRGPASDLLLLLWRRIDDSARLERFGNNAVLARWLALDVP